MASRTIVEPWLAQVGTWGEKITGRRVIFLATTGTMAQLSTRIWGRGELTSGQRLAYVENYAVYVTSPPWPRKPSRQLGKPDKSGKRRKTKGAWFPTYLAAKADQGRKDRPFELNARLRKAYFGGAAIPTPKERSALRCDITLQGEEAAKWEGLTEKKGDFTKLNASERTAHLQRVRDIYRAEVLNKL